MHKEQLPYNKICYTSLTYGRSCCKLQSCKLDSELHTCITLLPNHNFTLSYQRVSCICQLRKGNIVMNFGNMQQRETQLF